MYVWGLLYVSCSLWTGTVLFFCGLHVMAGFVSRPILSLMGCQTGGANGSVVLMFDKISEIRLPTARVSFCIAVVLYLLRQIGKSDY